MGNETSTTRNACHAMITYADIVKQRAHVALTEEGQAAAHTQRHGKVVEPASVSEWQKAVHDRRCSVPCCCGSTESVKYSKHSAREDDWIID